MNPHRPPRPGLSYLEPSENRRRAVTNPNPFLYAAGQAPASDLDDVAGGPSTRVIWWLVLIVNGLLWVLVAVGLWATWKLLVNGGAPVAPLGG